jgi:hypothetical protein
VAADATAPVDPTVASSAYQKILAVFAASTGGLRAKDVCQALGLGITAKDTEGIRAKLKRLVARQILVETEPGLFTLVPATSAQLHERGSYVSAKSKVDISSRTTLSRRTRAPPGPGRQSRRPPNRTQRHRTAPNRDEI